MVKSFLEFETNLMLFKDTFKKPALFLFYINGASYRKTKINSHNKPHLAVMFHLIWLLATIANLWCLTDFLYSVHIFTIFAKAIALATWWTIHHKREDLNNLLRSLKLMLKFTNLNTCSFSRLLLKMSPFLMVIIVASPAILWLSLTTELTDSCVVFWTIGESERWYVTIYFILLSTTQQYVNWCLPCAAAAFYICFCIETSRIARSLAEKMHTKEVGCLQIRKYYRMLVNLMARLDSALSLAILLCLTRCFMEFFRALTLYFQYSKDVHEIRLILSAVFYSLESGILYAAVIILADRLQVDCNELRKSLLRHSDHTDEINTWKAVEKCSQLFEDKEDFKLTAWKMFRLKKKVMFTTVTSLLTYGIILHQFHN